METEKDTWIAYIYCASYWCKIKPKTKHVCIRRKQKEDINWIKKKIERCAKYWNKGNLGFRNEGFVLDLKQIIEDGKNDILGKIGHRQE